MWLLRPKRVLAEECYRWSMVVHIAATAFSVGAMTHSQAACDHERCNMRTIGRLALHRQYPGLHPDMVQHRAQPHIVAIQGGAQLHCSPTCACTLEEAGSSL
jgi:hypothetical protein